MGLSRFSKVKFYQTTIDRGCSGRLRYDICKEAFKNLLHSKQRLFSADYVVREIIQPYKGLSCTRASAATRTKGQTGSSNIKSAGEHTHTKNIRFSPTSDTILAKSPHFFFPFSFTEIQGMCEDLEIRIRKHTMWGNGEIGPSLESVE